jgi:hypothetical protein
MGSKSTLNNNYTGTPRYAKYYLILSKQSGLAPKRKTRNTMLAL